MSVQLFTAKTVTKAKQKSLQMCAELRHCQRWVTDRERQRVPQWRTRDGKTSLSVSCHSKSRYCQIAACCGTEMTSASRSRNRVAQVDCRGPSSPEISKLSSNCPEFWNYPEILVNEYLTDLYWTCTAKFFCNVDWCTVFLKFFYLTTL